MGSPVTALLCPHSSIIARGCRVQGPEIMSKYVGESEAEVRRLFHRARAQAPCVVFLDEIDAMAAARSFTGGDSGGSGVSVCVCCRVYV